MPSSSIMILIPVKSFAGAKQRLAPALDRRERSELARAMFEDVLNMLAGWQARPAVAVIAGDAEAQRLARRFRFEIIEDTANADETEAVALATRTCAARGVERTLVIPADIPMVEASELDAILRAGDAVARANPAPVGYSVLSPAADGRGTNAALRCPPGLFALYFGDDSFEPHLRAARATGWPCTVLPLPGIALDVDRPADLGALLAAENRTRSQELLRTWGVPERLERLERLEMARAANELCQRA